MLLRAKTLILAACAVTLATPAHAQSARATVGVSVQVVIPPIARIDSVTTRTVEVKDGMTLLETRVRVEANTGYSIHFTNASTYPVEIVSEGGRSLPPGATHIVQARRPQGGSGLTTVRWRVNGAPAGAEIPLTIMLTQDGGV